MKNFSIEFVTAKTTPYAHHIDFLSGPEVKEELMKLINTPDTISIRIREGHELVFTTARYEDSKYNLINSLTIDKLGFLVECK
jgi:hypothetical protein